MENGADMIRAGATYTTYGLLAEGVSHVIDSFAAIKQVVFENGEASMGEVVHALADNFTGHEALRSKRLVKDFAVIVEELNHKYDKIRFLPGAGTFSWYIAIGEG